MEVSIAGLSRYQISQFFQTHSSATQQKCDAEAARITGTSVHSAIVQGGTSYTVVSEMVVVQFRAGDSTLDLDLLQCAEKAYAGFTPHHQSVGKLGELHIYRMNNVGGISIYLARANPVRPQLPQIFASDWPMVPNHTDLLENNIHMDLDTGKITGICDWKDTEISPFGMSLGDLETMLGIGIILKESTKTGWRYHANQQTLRSLFWDRFYAHMGHVSQEQRDRIEVARLVGILLAYGFDCDKDGNKFPATEGSDGVGYLDGVVLGLTAS